MYYWTKYWKKSVSIIGFRNEVNNWAEGADGKVELVETLDNPFQNRTKLRLYNFGACKVFMCDFLHFSGKGKPWLSTPPEDLADPSPKSLEQPTHMWYRELYELNSELNMGLNFSDWKLKGIRPAFGLFTTLSEMGKRIGKAENDA